ncbi:MAG: 3-deoxy-manno-octulosonate cytidylyltransferase [Deltaproteobacteria bacterium]|nr:3-deoxy-manno-octulosonate cytidylyltransferase [Deltaproteobacteria bacterium]
MNCDTDVKATVIIPARYASSRFPGKPLALISGKSMIRRVYENAQKSPNIKDVFIATDDERIAKEAESFGGKYIITSTLHKSGTDRAAEATNIIGLKKEDIIINVQGDQPLFDFRCLDEILTPFKTGFDGMSTLVCRITKPEEITDPKDVKTVFDNNGFALYFSRTSIPYDRDGLTLNNKYKHLGFYAYTKEFLEKFTSLPEGELEKRERLEQLRALEYGLRIKIVVTNYDSFEIDLPCDIEKAETIISEKLKGE